MYWKGTEYKVQPFKGSLVDIIKNKDYPYKMKNYPLSNQKYSPYEKKSPLTSLT